MAENKPIAEAEATYLDKENDLLSLTQLKSNTTENPISSNPPTPLMIAIISVTAIPILLFRIIPGLISRITVILLFVSSIACMSKPQAPGSFFNGRESRHFLFVYLGVLVLAALVI